MPHWLALNKSNLQDRFLKQTFHLLKIEQDESYNDHCGINRATD